MSSPSFKWRLMNKSSSHVKHSYQKSAMEHLMIHDWPYTSQMALNLYEKKRQTRTIPSSWIQVIHLKDQMDLFLILNSIEIFIELWEENPCCVSKERILGIIKISSKPYEKSWLVFLMKIMWPIMELMYQRILVDISGSFSVGKVTLIQEFVRPDIWRTKSYRNANIIHAISILHRLCCPNLLMILWIYPNKREYIYYWLI